MYFNSTYSTTNDYFLCLYWTRHQITHVLDIALPQPLLPAVNSIHRMAESQFAAASHTVPSIRIPDAAHMALVSSLLHYSINHVAILTECRAKVDWSGEKGHSRCTTRRRWKYTKIQTMQK